MLASSIYEDFINNNYGKTPCVLKKNKFRQSIFSQKDFWELFPLIFSAQALTWTVNSINYNNIKINLNMQTNLNNFINYISQLNCFNNYTFSGHNCHQYLPILQTRVTAFLAPIFKKCGIPSNGVNIMIFGGKYQVTPAGLHSDPCDIFLFPILNGKQLLTWPMDLFEHEKNYINGKINARRLPHIDYKKYLKYSYLLNALEGDVLYFPAGTWHINDYLKDTNSIAFGVSIFRNSDVNKFISTILNNFMKSHQVTMASLMESIKLNLIQRQSAFGFVTGLSNDKTNKKICFNQKIIKEQHFNIFKVSKENILYIIANGRIIKTKQSNELNNLIENINTGIIFSLKEIDIKYHDLIQWLHTTNALKLL